MTENTDIIDADKARAQTIVDAIMGAVSAIEADNVARAGRGGPVQIVANMKSNLTIQAWQIAQAFDLPWSGPTFAIPAEPTGGV